MSKKERRWWKTMCEFLFYEFSGNEIFYMSNYIHSRQTVNIFPILVKLNFKRGEVTLSDIRTAMRSEVWVFVRGFLDSTLLWNSGERKCRAPSGNVSPSSSDRASICLEADSRPACDVISYIVRVARERRVSASITAINLDLYAHRRRFVLTTNGCSKELFDRVIANN